VSELESVWLNRALKGDPEAFSHLIETYQTPVYNLCYRMLGDPDEAEDAAQESFLRAYKGIRRYDESRPFSTWLLSIAAHYCIDIVRKRHYKVLSYDELPQFDPPDSAPGPESALILGESQRRVQALLARLAPQDRAAVVMRYWYDLSYEEIGEALSMTVSAVKSRLHRARKELAEEWSVQAQHAPAAKEAKGLERKHHESPAF
jgi:RNA polymerase sigma-70 factor, ECF subfamily